MSSQTLEPHIDKLRRAPSWHLARNHPRSFQTMSKKTSSNPRGYSNGHKARLFVTYWGLIAMLAALFFFSVGPLLSGQTIVILTIASFAIAGIATASVSGIKKIRE